jgi:hypothetical protein
VKETRDVQTLVILVGVANGTLLAAIGLGLWGHKRHPRELARAVGAVRWLAGALLAIGTVLARVREPGPAVPAPELILMAALAAPPGFRFHRRPLDWRDTTLILPALILAGAGLFQVASSASIAAQAALEPTALAITICGGLGARALGQALYWTIAPASGVTSPAPDPSRESATDTREETASASPTVAEEEPGVPMERASAVTYALLTLLAGGVAIVNLWRQGTVWGATASESGLAGVWLAWSAAWLGPHRPLRLRALLTIVAASSLILLAVSSR